METLIPIFTEGFTAEERLVSSMQSFISAAAARFNLNLGSVEGITIFDDYLAGVSRFNTGFDNKEILSASNDSAVGVGMTPVVLRNGVLGSHVLLPRRVAEQAMASDNAEASRKARYAIVHELAHANDHKRSADRFPTEVLDISAKENVLKVGCRATWSEYYVCRKVACEYPEAFSEIEEVVVRALERFDVETAIARRYAQNDERDEGQRHAVSAGFNLFIALARLLGHLDGLHRSFTQECRIMPAYLSNIVQASDVEQLQVQLRDLWDRIPEWIELNEVRTLFNPLSTILNRI